MRTCEVYFREEAIYIFSTSLTVTGLLITSTPMIKINRHASPAVLGEIVLIALRSFTEGVPKPESLEAVVRAVLNFTGLKTWNTFVKSNLFLLIRFSKAEIEIIPTRREGGSFMHLADNSVKAHSTPEEIGHALFEALRLCS
jgi:hypothetical protein